MKISLARAGALALTLGLTQLASAVTVFDNGVPDLATATGMTEFQVADNFTVAGSFSITNIRFWSAQDTLSAYTGSVSWAVFSNVAGLPGVSLNSGLFTGVGTSTGSTIGGGDAVYSFDIPVNFTLGAGNYWLALLNGSTPNPLAAGFMGWASSGTGTSPAAVYKDGTWISSGSETAFRIDGNVTVVPEPATTAMFVAGLLAVAGLRLSRRQ